MMAVSAQCETEPDGSRNSVVVVARCEAKYDLSQGPAGLETQYKTKSGQKRGQIRRRTDRTAIADWNYNQYSQ